LGSGPDLLALRLLLQSTPSKCTVVVAKSGNPALAQLDRAIGAVKWRRFVLMLDGNRDSLHTVRYNCIACM
jgi:hypothetical protein